MRFLTVFILFFACGCSLFQKKDPQKIDETSLVGKQLSPQESEELLANVGQNYIYGPGLGETILNVGTAVAFPPYLIYLVGNAVLSISGYEPLSVARALPDETGKAWSETFDEAVSGPGRVVAAVAGEEYRNREVAREGLKKYIATNAKPLENQTAYVPDGGNSKSQS